MSNNGFSAAGMSTAAANGHAEGYQAGYADAVKAVDAAQPAAAQEAVPYGYVFTDDPAKFAMPGSGFHFGPVPPTDAINIVPLYVAAAEVWHGPDDLPRVSPGHMGWFWVAVRRANGKTYNFPASYLNGMLLSDEDGSHDEPEAGNRYSYGAADEDEGSFRATGWHDAKEHSEYDSIYMPLLADGDELIAWRTVEDFPIKATSAEVGA